MRHLHAVTRDDEPEAGFTLIELMMVVLIIAILIAVLIPTFVGAKQRAQDRAVQSSVRNALTAARVIFSDHGGSHGDGAPSGGARDRLRRRHHDPEHSEHRLGGTGEHDLLRGGREVEVGRMLLRPRR